MQTLPRLALVLFLSASMLACEAQSPAQSPAQPPAQPVVPADTVERPRLEVSLLDGSPWNIESQRGRWVVVNFWATWCAPCLKEIPDLAGLHDSRDDVVVIGLAYEEIETADLLDFLKRHPASYPIAIVDVYAPPEDFDTPRGLPMTWLIAPDGSVAKKFLGPVTSQDLLEVVDGTEAAG